MPGYDDLAWLCCQCGFIMSSQNPSCTEVWCQHRICSNCPVQGHRFDSVMIASPIFYPAHIEINNAREYSQELSGVGPVISQNGNPARQQPGQNTSVPATPGSRLTSPAHSQTKTTHPSTLSSSPSGSVHGDKVILTPSTDPDESSGSEWEDDSHPIETHELGNDLPPASLWAQLLEADISSSFLTALEEGYERWRRTPQNTPTNQPKSSTTVTHDKNDGGQGQNGESVRSSRKRPRPRNDGESENDESPERPGGRPRLNPPQPDPTALNLLLACPFWKQDSRLWRECFRYKLKRIRDLKQHLRRNHGKVCYCVRCGEEFENPGDLDLHYNQDVPCAKAAFQVKWLSEPQKKELRENRANPKLSVEKQWYEIWDIVFPEAPKPDSPYLDASISEDLSSFREFFLQQGPEIIRQTAENQGLLPGLIAIQERQFYQTFLARIYDRWASSRGHAQYPVDSSHLDHDDRISQEVPEPDSSLTLGGSVEEEPSIPPGIHVLSEGPHQEQQIGSRTSDSHDNQHYDYGEYVNESPNTDEPSAGALNANSSFNGLEELMIYTDGVPPIQSRNSEASSQEPISAIQNHNLQNYDGWSGLGDFTSYQGGHLHVLEDVPEGSSFHDQRIVAPVRTISSTPEDRNPPDTQSDSMRETLLHDLDVHSLDFLDDFPWDGNMNVNNSGSQLDPEGELRPSRNQA